MDSPPWMFIHIPKTAGRAFGGIVASEFYKTYPRPQLAYYFHLIVGSGRHIEYQSLAGHIFYKDARDILPPGTKYMTVLRDPIDRACSHWGHILQHVDHYFHAVANYMTFSDFIRNPNATPLISEFQARYISAQVSPPRSTGPIEYQKHCELMDVSVSYEETMKALDGFSFIGIQEHFPESVRRACEIMGIEPVIVKQKKTPDYRSRLSREDILYLENMNYIDMAIYDEFKSRFEHG